MEDEFRQKIRDITFNSWLSKHPGGTREQWEESERLSEQSNRRWNEIQEQAKIRRYAIYGFGLFLVWRYAILPAIATTAICVVVNVPWVVMFIVVTILL